MQDLATPTLQTLAPLGLRPRALKGPVSFATHQSHVQWRLQHRPQAGSTKVWLNNQACCEEKRGTGQKAWNQHAVANKTEFEEEASAIYEKEEQILSTCGRG